MLFFITLFHNQRLIDNFVPKIKNAILDPENLP